MVNFEKTIFKKSSKNKHKNTDEKQSQLIKKAKYKSIKENSVISSNALTIAQ